MHCEEEREQVVEARMEVGRASRRPEMIMVVLVVGYSAAVACG